MLNAVTGRCSHGPCRRPGGEVIARGQGLGHRTTRLEPRRRPAPRAVAFPRRRRRRRDRRLRARPRPEVCAAGHRAQRRRRRRPRATRSSSSTSAHARRRRSTPRAAAPASRPARCGGRRAARPAARPGARWPAPRTTSASSATRSAAASLAGAPHGLAAEQRARDRARHRRRPARARRRRRTSPTCSGRCAAAAATSASSPRWSSRLFPVSEVYAGMLLFPCERAGEVLRAWREWTRTAPDEVTTSIGRSCSFPPLPEIPEPLRGRFVVIEGASLGDEAAAPSRSRRCASSGRSWTPSRWSRPAALSRCTWTRPAGARPGDHALLGELTTRRSTRSCAAAGPDSPLLFAELRHLGGALARRPTTAARSARSTARTPSSARASSMSPRWARRSWRPQIRRSAQRCPPLRPRAQPTRQLPQNRPADTSTFYTDDAYARLGAVRAGSTYGVMAANHEIPAA